MSIKHIHMLTTVLYCYILFIGGEICNMKIIISNTSMVPIYEQIVDQIKKMIIHGDIKENDILPSVRSLSKELKISALTVKKAYDYLEKDGFTITVHGKGTFVKGTNKNLVLEEIRKEIENELENTIAKGKRYGLTDDDIRELFQLILED